MLQLIETAAIDPDEASRREEARRRQLAALAPTKWKPGQSGNPNGRTPAVHPDVRKLAKKFGPEAIDRLKFWARSEDPRASIPACSILLDRGCGKSGTAEVDTSLPAEFEGLTVAQRIEALRARRRALEAQAADSTATGNAAVATA